MSQTISEFIGVDQDTFEPTGAFDAVLDMDSRFYIDPLLLKTTKAAELSTSYDKLLENFNNILKLLASSKRQGDAFWRQAERLLTTRELKGLCIGYSKSGTGGSGMGEGFRKKILTTAKEIVDVGVSDPSIFGLIGILEEGIGCDRISDMVGRMIAEDVLAYSERIFKQLKAKTKPVEGFGRKYALAINPYNGVAILLIPTDILRPLPITRSFDDIDAVCDYNRRLRLKVNRMIGGAWSKTSTTEKKRVIRRTILSREDILRDFLNDYISVPPPPYDFAKDPLGEVRWHSDARLFASRHPLSLSLGQNPTPQDIVRAVLAICEKFRDLIENNGLHDLLYETPRKPKNESAAQKLFYGIADSYCEANNLDLSPEVNAGRGAVDFKFSRGYRNRVTVEVKLTTHQRLKHGLTVQLEEYQKAEKTSHSVFLVINVVGGSPRRLQEVQKLVSDAKAKGERIPEVVVINAWPKPSASKPQKDTP